MMSRSRSYFILKDTATTEIYTLSLHDALPIYEIRRHGALLIDNPYWMLGVPFREDPGVPALYGAYLAMTGDRSEEHTSELQSRQYLVCRLLLDKKKT